MSVSGISNINSFNPIYNRNTQRNNSTPVSFGYGDDSYSSSVASSYIQKQQAQKQQMELEKQKKEKWKQFGWDVFKGVTIGGTLILATILGVACTKAGREMAQSLTHNYGGLSSTASGDTSKFKTVANDNITANKCKEMLQEVNLDKTQLDYVFENICMANKSIKKDYYLDGVDINTCGNRGAILYGRGGIGKSYAMEKIAKACGASYSSIKGSDFMNMYQGMSEGNLKGILLDAKAQAEKTPDKPVIIFLDEGESILGAARQNGSNNTNAMLRSILLGAMETEGTDALPPNVKFIVTTNFVDDIDEPYRRDGRLGTPMELLCPSAEKQKEIMQTQFKKILSKDTYAKYESEIKNYLNNRLKYMQEHEKDKDITQNKEKINQLNEKIKELYTAYVTTQKNYCYALTDTENTQVTEYLTELQNIDVKIKACENAIDTLNNMNKASNNADERYFNFTPAEIKGLVSLFAQTLLVKNGPGFNETNMVALEKGKISELRENLKKMAREHNKKM